MAPPGGHYSHAVAANGFVFVSGELPIAPDGTKLNDRAVRGASPAGSRQRRARLARRRAARSTSSRRCAFTSPTSTIGRRSMRSMPTGPATPSRHVLSCRCRSCTMAFSSKSRRWRLRSAGHHVQRRGVRRALGGTVETHLATLLPCPRHREPFNDYIGPRPGLLNQPTANEMIPRRRFLKGTAISVRQRRQAFWIAVFLLRHRRKVQAHPCRPVHARYRLM